MLQISENIKQARISAGKTQKEMADLLKVKRTTYANWEDKTEPDVNTLMKISNILGIEISQLINAEVKKETKQQDQNAETIAQLARAIVQHSETINSQQYVIRIYIEKEIFVTGEALKKAEPLRRGRAR